MFEIRKAMSQDTKRIVEIYNSNSEFLKHHLGVSAVDEAFALDEQKLMNEFGFRPCVIVDDEGTLVGLIEYKPDETVYLSLLMLDRSQHSKGLGTKIYNLFESRIAAQGYTAVRIDVVNDYEDNAAGFWEKLGFRSEETVELEWGEKKSRAVVMKKSI